MEKMPAQEILKAYKKSFDIRLEDYFKQKEKQAQKIDPKQNNNQKNEKTHFFKN